LGGKPFRFHESELDTITVGNYVPFQQGYMKKREEADRSSRAEPWQFLSCVDGEDCSKDEDRRLPVAHNEPLAFIRTDSAFIEDHNDVFSDEVSAYLAAIIAEARHKRVLGGSPVHDNFLPEPCRAGRDGSGNERFAFRACFNEYFRGFASIALDGSP
jgi:hypothetical protein